MCETLYFISAVCKIRRCNQVLTKFTGRIGTLRQSDVLRWCLKWNLKRSSDNLAIRLNFSGPWQRILCADTNHVLAIIVQSVNLSDDGCLPDSKSPAVQSHPAPSLHNDWEALWSTHQKLDGFIITSTSYVTLALDCFVPVCHFIFCVKNKRISTFNQFSHHFLMSESNVNPQSITVSWSSREFTSSVCSGSVELQGGGTTSSWETRVEGDCNWFLAQVTLSHI